MRSAYLVGPMAQPSIAICTVKGPVNDEDSRCDGCAGFREWGAKIIVTFVFNLHRNLRASGKRSDSSRPQID